MKYQPPTFTVSKPWFSGTTEADTEFTSIRNSVLGLCIGLLFGGLVFHYRSATVGLSIISIAVAVGVLGIASAGCRKWFSKWFGRLGNVLGIVVAAATLTPLFFFGFTLARLVFWITGRDPLQLSHDRPRTYWLPMDQGVRKSRHIHAMFVTEPRLHRARWSWGAMLVVAIGGLLVGELILRAYGYGDAVLYTPSAMSGFYPAANQEVTRMGGRVVTNQYGMRAPEFDLKKPENVFRILMIGDSTLYGGQYVDQSELYPRLLQQRLSELTSEKEVEVLNIGVNGWGPFNKLGYIREFGSFDSDVAVLCLPVDDFRRPLIHLWDTPYFRPAPPRCAYEEVLYHLNWRQRSRGQRATADEQSEQIERGFDAYVELVELLKQQGCEVVVEVLPSLVAGTTSTVPERESRLVDRFSIRLYNAGLDEPTFPVGFLAGHGEAAELYHDSIHLDIAGHSAYANYLVTQMTSTKMWRTNVVKSRIGE